MSACEKDGLRQAVHEILQLVPPHGVIGLGTGRAATAFVRGLAVRVASGLQVRCVPTSRKTAQLAGELGLTLVEFAAVDSIDFTVDGADEVDPRLDLIKGFGGALVREKIVAAATRHYVILVGEEKVVPQLGSRGKLPVEVVPFALPLCLRRLTELGCTPEPRPSDGALFETDNHNHILDCGIRPLAAPAEFEQRLRAIPGVVGTGLFLGMADSVFVYGAESVRRLDRR